MNWRSRFLILLVVLLMLAIGWGFFTNQLPFGISRSLPAGSFLAGTPALAPGRLAAGQPAALGSVSYAVTNVSRSQDLLPTDQAADAAGKATFVVLQVQVRNDGREPVTPGLDGFELLDGQGRRYGADLEASRAAAAGLKRRAPGTAVQPGSTIATALAFEVPSTATGLTLRVTTGNALMELPPNP